METKKLADGIRYLGEHAGWDEVETRTRALEAEGCTRSDAQAVVEAEARMACGSGWTNDRCTKRLGHRGLHSNE
jgi:hypothetical protein